MLGIVLAAFYIAIPSLRGEEPRPTPLPAGELPAELRIITYNIHHGEGIDRKFDLERIAKVLLDERPDLVALQEVDQQTRRSGGVDQPAELARLTGLTVVFGRNIDFEGGGYGTAVLSRLPVLSSKSVKLKSFYPPTPHNPEQRGVQVIELGSTAGKPEMLFLCTHLDSRPPDDERIHSAITINELIRKWGNLPALLAGDLNAPPESPAIRELAKEWAIAGLDSASAKRPKADRPARYAIKTFPAQKPRAWIDYVLYRPTRRWRVVEVRVLNEPVASDHRPLLAVLRRED